jgi:hypothetical protein
MRFATLRTPVRGAAQLRTEVPPISASSRISVPGIATAIAREQRYNGA